MHCKNLVPYYDYIFTQDLNCIKFHRGIGRNNVFHLPLAANQDVCKPSLKEDTYHDDLSFIGTAFENRIAFVDSIAEYEAEKNTKLTINLNILASVNMKLSVWCFQRELNLAFYKNHLPKRDLDNFVEFIYSEKTILHAN